MMTESRVRIGYWTQAATDPKTDGLLWPEDCVDLSWDVSERSEVAAYLGETLPEEEIQYNGISWCRFCRKPNGSCDFGDGTYIWPQGYAHYVVVHGVKPPQEFIDHVLSASSMISYPVKEPPVQDVMRLGKSWVSLTATIAFVPTQHSVGTGKHTHLLYVKTHPCVVLSRCPACKAPPGKLCWSRSGERTVSCHVDRKDAWKRSQKRHK
jgi:hypothetical protein